MLMGQSRMQALWSLFQRSRRHPWIDNRQLPSAPRSPRKPRFTRPCDQRGVCAGAAPGPQGWRRRPRRCRRPTQSEQVLTPIRARMVQPTATNQHTPSSTGRARGLRHKDNIAIDTSCLLVTDPRTRLVSVW